MNNRWQYITSPAVHETAIYSSGMLNTVLLISFEKTQKICASSYWKVKRTKVNQKGYNTKLNTKDRKRPSGWAEGAVAHPEI
jgi:hypothetical protein